MSKKKTIIATALFLVFLATAVICWLAFSPETIEGEKTVTVDVTHKDGQTNTFVLQTDAEYLGEAMQEEGLLMGEDSSYGMFILSVDGELADESNQEWWGYTKSGEYVEYGVDGCVIADGDHYEFTLNIGW